MNNEKSKAAEKLNTEEESNVSGGKNIPPKEEHIYVCHRPSFKHPIALKYGGPCPTPNRPDLSPQPLYGVPSPYPKRLIKNNQNNSGSDVDGEHE